MTLPRRWKMCKFLSASHTLRLLRTWNGVPTRRCQRVLQWYGPWYLYGCIEHVHSEADEVIAQVRSRTLSIEKWRRSALLPNNYVLLRDASLIMPTRGG